MLDDSMLAAVASHTKVSNDMRAGDAHLSTELGRTGSDLPSSSKKSVRAKPKAAGGSTKSCCC